MCPFQLVKVLQESVAALWRNSICSMRLVDQRRDNKLVPDKRDSFLQTTLPSQYWLDLEIMEQPKPHAAEGIMV